MLEEIKEIRVPIYEKPKNIIFQIKTLLLNNDIINIISTTNSSGVACRAADKLVRYGYVTIENIRTTTDIENYKRISKLIITIKKTKDFQKLYDLYEDNKKQREQNIKENKKEEK